MAIRQDFLNPGNFCLTSGSERRILVSMKSYGFTPEQARVSMESRLRAQTIPGRRNAGPSMADWYDEEEEVPNAR